MTGGRKTQRSSGVKHAFFYDTAGLGFIRCSHVAPTSLRFPIDAVRDVRYS